MCYAVFGFATSETLIERKETNVGLRDQRAALACMCLYPILIPTDNTDIVDQSGIRDHVEAFGGDPDRGTTLSFSIRYSSADKIPSSYCRWAKRGSC